MGYGKSDATTPHRPDPGVICWEGLSLVPSSEPYSERGE